MQENYHSDPLPPGDQNVEQLLGKAYTPEPIDPGFRQRVFAKLDEVSEELAEKQRPKTPRVYPRRIFAIVGGLAALVLLVIGLRLFFGGGDPTQIPPTHQDVDGMRVSIRPRPPLPKVETAARGSTLKTAPGEHRFVRLEDGTHLLLNEKTQVRVTEHRRVKLEQGEIFIEVSPRNAQQSGATFTVETPQRQLKALGTKFAVKVDSQGTGALVTQGKVKVDGLSSPLEAGEQVHPGETKVIPAPRASHILSWAQNLLGSEQPSLIPLSSYSGGALVARTDDGQEQKLELRKYHIDVHIENGFARTTIDQTYFNGHPRRIEGTFFFPLPNDASLSRLVMYVNGKKMEGGMVEKNRGRAIYQQIVDSQKDPALLEWIDGSTFRMRVFPLEARQEKRIVLSYTQRLSTLYGNTSYRFPAGHSLGEVKKWSLNVRVKHGANWKVSSPLQKLTKSQEATDLILKASEKQFRFNRDVVINLEEDNPPEVGVARWSTTRHEGFNYLMLRLRPKLPAQKKIERRDWVILFESSAERDPMLARAQVEVIRSFLSQVSHEDTFKILTVNHRVSAVAEAKKATPTNVRVAIEKLEKVHLIGGLDLGQALEQASIDLKKVKNPYLLHVGSGHARLGERREHPLVGRIAKGARYIGVAVGKSWSRSFMELAASKTGGYLTRINPDEKIAWRAFELFSTLNAPRMLDLNVWGGPTQMSFLNCSNIVAQGEEICVIARTEEPIESLPPTLNLWYKVNGEQIKEKIKLTKPAPGADYLPRTWTRLEIERLLRLGANAHRKRIIELSKAMYVMTPFTSLLVLENDEMYRRFKVDRGRKDHWALYPCPDEIPVVKEPLPGQNPKKQPKFDSERRKPSLQSVLSTIRARGLPYFGRSSQSVMPFTPLTLARFEDHLSILLASQTEKNLARSRLGRLVDYKLPVSSPRLFARGGEPDGKPEVENNELDLLFDNSGMGPVNDLEWKIADQLDRRKKSLGDLSAAKRGELLNRYYFRSIYVQQQTISSGPVRGIWPRVASADFEPISITREAETLLYFAMIQDAQRSPLILTTAPYRALKHLLARPGAVLYQRPHFHAGRNLLRDLLLHAPGMNTTWLDVQAVLEDEADLHKKLTRGRIDPKAKAILSKTRSQNWQSVTIPSSGMRQSFELLYNGKGEFRYDRHLTSGLREIVLCDGEHLWHLYPEIGLGARRKVGRHHRAALTQMVPWFVPSAEDLAWSADVIALDDNTVSIKPHRGGVETHLIFKNGRLIERRLVVKKKAIIKQIIENGSVRLFDQKDKKLGERELTLKSIAKPEWKLDTDQLVILPMPFRTRAQVIKDHKLYSTPRYPQLDSKSAMALLSALVVDRTEELPKLITQRFLARGDRRPGLLVLLIANGHKLETVGIGNTDADGPLEEYLRHFRAFKEKEKAEGEGKKDSRPRFFRQIEAFHSLLGYGARREVELVKGRNPRVVEVEECRSPLLLWLLMEKLSLQERDHKGTDPMREKLLRAATKALSSVPGLGHAARYELACYLYVQGKETEARDLFRKIYADVFRSGKLPTIDAYFRKALQSEPDEKKNWNALMRQYGAELIKEHRYKELITLAEQCSVVGDMELGDALLASASFKSDPVKHREQLIHVVASLKSHHRYEAAEQVIRDMLQNEKLSQDATLWRIAWKLSELRNRGTQSMKDLERALELEWRNPPKKIDLKKWQEEHSLLLSHYEKLARAALDLERKPSKDLTERVTRLAERWRSRGVGAQPLQQVSRTLRLVGKQEQAWDYITTRLGTQHATHDQWVNLATVLQGERNFELADRALHEAAMMVPEDPRGLWRQVENWRKAGQPSKGRDALQQIVEGKWDTDVAQYRELQTRARRLLGEQ